MPGLPDTVRLTRSRLAEATLPGAAPGARLVGLVGVAGGLAGASDKTNRATSSILESDEGVTLLHRSGTVGGVLESD